MISFYPGPSRVYDEIPRYVKDAYKKGILSINHRSEEFMKISETTVKLLKQKLNIPKDYTIFYTSSATECWEIIAQSVVTEKSYHLYNGSFGQKWFDYTKRIRPGAESLPFDREEKLDPEKFRFSGERAVICLTQNETSNGTQVRNSILRKIKKNNPNHFVAVDATSSMGGIDLDFRAADIWFASVQKCFGMPAGLGILICSPAVIQHVRQVGEKAHYNSLTFMIEMMNKWQTSCTPNVLNIYVLMRVLEKVKPIKEVNKKIRERYKNWIEFFASNKSIHHLIKNTEVHSFTVLPLQSNADDMTRIKKKAKQEGLLLGEGYGELKASTFRIANFPAIKKSEIEKLQHFLKSAT